MEESPLENIRELRELEDRVEASSAQWRKRQSMREIAEHEWQK